MDGMDFNRNVKAAIERGRLCAARVAREAGMNPKIFYKILALKRKVYADEVLPICRALGCTVDEMFEKGA